MLKCVKQMFKKAAKVLKEKAPVVAGGAVALGASAVHATDVPITIPATGIDMSGTVAAVLLIIVGVLGVAMGGKFAIHGLKRCASAITGWIR